MGTMILQSPLPSYQRYSRSMSPKQAIVYPIILRGEIKQEEGRRRGGGEKEAIREGKKKRRE